jgi:hypothetical protein
MLQRSVEALKAAPQVQGAFLKLFFPCWYFGLKSFLLFWYCGLKSFLLFWYCGLKSFLLFWSCCNCSYCFLIFRAEVVLTVFFWYFGLKSFLLFWYFGLKSFLLFCFDISGWNRANCFGMSCRSRGVLRIWRKRNRK